MSDWSSDGCSSDLDAAERLQLGRELAQPVLGGVARLLAHQLGDADPVLELLRRDDIEQHDAAPRFLRPKIGRATGRERVCQYVYISVVAVSLKQNTITMHESY